jgi:hypothetical protein
MFYRSGYTVSYLESTLAKIPQGAASKRLTRSLNTLESTLMKKRGEGGRRHVHACSQPSDTSPGHMCGCQNSNRALHSAPCFRYTLIRWKVMSRRRNQRAAFVSACICMLAVALLYAPLAAAVWAAQTMTCCTENYCPIAAHHHQNAPAEPAHELNCSHEISMLMSCTISCCQTTERPMVTAIAFVLPDLSFASMSCTVTQVAETPPPIELPGALAPLSPPPRFDSAAL